MNAPSDKSAVTIPALKVHQWMPDWNKVNFSSDEGQTKPASKHFLLFSIRASHLKALTGVYRRTTNGGKARAIDPNVQRGHEESRSDTIREFVQYGFPWCEMTSAQRNQPDANDLRKPGWLPSAILVNILQPKDKRNGAEIPSRDLIKVEENGSTAMLQLPQGFNGSKWEPSEVYPLEVIDGQHRLWAFEDFDKDEEFELPVVAFCGLDRGWQAYLFWSVNITPKKINRSLAFDLYPLLRQQSWLEKFTGHKTYRETRCQELVEALWSHGDSPWHQRINMLGETKENREYKGPSATQAAWIRSLMQTMVKAWEGTGTRTGGLFGASGSVHDPILPWSRAMQAAFLIYVGNSLKRAIKKSHAEWAQNLRQLEDAELFEGDDPAFYGQYSLISTDQGIRGILYIINDLCFVARDSIKLNEWRFDEVPSKKKAAATEETIVTESLHSLSKTEVARYIDSIATALADYDWRTSSTPKLPEQIRIRQGVFRGSSGYKEMRRQLLGHIKDKGGSLGLFATTVSSSLGY